MEDSSGKENKSSKIKGTAQNIEKCDITPNKAHRTQPTIPETPIALQFTKERDTRIEPRSKAIRKGQKRRQALRIDSSSDEEKHPKKQNNANKNSPLFSNVRFSKRRKLSDSFEKIPDIMSHVPSCAAEMDHHHLCEGDKNSRTSNYSCISVLDGETSVSYLSDDGRHNVAENDNLTKLCELFPQHTRYSLESVLDRCGDLDDAVSKLLMLGKKIKSMNKNTRNEK